MKNVIFNLYVDITLSNLNEQMKNKHGETLSAMKLKLGKNPIDEASSEDCCAIFEIISDLIQASSPNDILQSLGITFVKEIKINADNLVKLLTKSLENSWDNTSTEIINNFIHEYGEEAFTNCINNAKDATNVIYRHICFKGLVLAAKTLSKLNSLENTDHFLHYARTAYFALPSKSKEFNDVCLELRKKVQKHHSILKFKTYTRRATKESLYFDIFDKYYPSNKFLNKEEAIKVAIVEITALFYTPKKCVKYLQFLNNEFLRYFKEKYGIDFPTLNANEFTYYKIDGLIYPCPTNQFVGIQKKHALKEFLIALFQSEKLAKNAYKWIGFVPNAKADEMVKNGDFFIDDWLGTGLFHNEIAHMLQQALIVYAIQDEQISLTFYQNGVSDQITIQDILTGLVTLQGSTGVSLWAHTRDSRIREDITFVDPFRLGTVIMHEGEAFGLIGLANSMRDNFCKSFLHQLKLYRSNSHYADMDTTRFIANLNDTELKDFFNLQWQLHETFKKRHISTDSENSFYAIVPKSYEVNQFFVPRKFSLTEAISTLTSEMITDLFLTAAGIGDLDVITTLLRDKKINPNQSGMYGVTALSNACLTGIKEIVVYLVENPATNVNQALDDGRTPLFFASWNNYPDIVQTLLDHGANPNCLVQGDHCTPLFAAAQMGNVQVIYHLLKKNADPHLFLTNTVQSLRRVAETYEVESAMEKFIKDSLSKQYSPSAVPVLPSEVANIMGHVHIANLLRQMEAPENLAIVSEQLTNELQQSSPRSAMEVVDELINIAKIREELRYTGNASSLSMLTVAAKHDYFKDKSQTASVTFLSEKQIARDFLLAAMKMIEHNQFLGSVNSLKIAKN